MNNKPAGSVSSVRAWLQDATSQCELPARLLGLPFSRRHAAAASGNVLEILSIGEQDEKRSRALSMNSTDRNASTPLHHAAFEGQVRQRGPGSAVGEGLHAELAAAAMPHH